MVGRPFFHRPRPGFAPGRNVCLPSLPPIPHQKSNSEFRELLTKAAESKTDESARKKSALEESVAIAARNAKKKEEAKKK